MKNKKGFTLVELLAVIVILGILTAIAVPSVLGISKKIKTNMWESKVKTIEVALELWADDNKANCSSAIESLTVEQLMPQYLKSDENGQNVFTDPSGLNTENLLNTKIKDIKVNKDKTINISNVCKKKDGNILADLKEKGAASYLTSSTTNGGSIRGGVTSVNPFSPGTVSEDTIWNIEDFSGPCQASDDELLEFDPSKVSSFEIVSGNSVYLKDGKLYTSCVDTGSSVVKLNLKDGISKNITINNYRLSAYVDSWDYADSQDTVYEFCVATDYINYANYPVEINIEDGNGNDLSGEYTIPYNDLKSGSGISLKKCFQLRPSSPNPDYVTPSINYFEIQFSVDTYASCKPTTRNGKKVCANWYN